MLKSFEKANEFLESFLPDKKHRHPGRLGLARMRHLAELLGNPHLSCPVVHVAGTSGKGSTATIIASILAQAYRVGLHTSPHLVSVTERIKILGSRKKETNVKDVDERMNDSDISQHDFIRLLNKIAPFAQKMEKSRWGKPSYFEVVTACAFLYFKEQKVDFAVVEAGMGGRWDGTNIVRPSLVVLTNVGLDHTDVLGKRIEKIAEDKTGVIKEKATVVSGVKQESVRKIVEGSCKRKKAKLWLLNRDFSYKIRKAYISGSVFDYFGKHVYKRLKISLLGEHQVENATLAIKAVGELGKLRVGKLINLDESRFYLVRKGLRSAYIPGRLEIVQEKPLVVLDGAHNPAKIDALAKTIKSIFHHRRIICVLAIKKGKLVKKMILKLLEIVDCFVLTSFYLTTDIGDTFSYKPAELCRIIEGIDKTKKILIVEDTSKALKKAKELTGRKDLILVTGSLYLIGDIKKRYETN